MPDQTCRQTCRCSISGEGQHRHTRPEHRRGGAACVVEGRVQKEVAGAQALVVGREVVRAGEVRGGGS